MKIKCPKCNYVWNTLKPDIMPKKCPRCQKRLDYKQEPIILKEK